MNDRNDHDDQPTRGLDEGSIASWWPDDPDPDDAVDAVDASATGSAGEASGGWTATNGTTSPAWAVDPAPGGPWHASTASPGVSSAALNGPTAARPGEAGWTPSRLPGEPPTAGPHDEEHHASDAGWTPSRLPGEPPTAGPHDEEQLLGGAGTHRPTSVSRWIIAVLAGAAVAVLAVLGVNAVASAATAADISTNVFGPFGGSHQNRNPPFSASAGRAGGRGGKPNAAGTGGRPATPVPVQPAPGAATTSARVDGTIATIDGQRLEIDTASGRTAVELTATTTIRDGAATINRSALVAGQSVQVTGTRNGDLVTASTVEVVH